MTNGKAVRIRQVGIQQRPYPAFLSNHFHAFVPVRRTADKLQLIARRIRRFVCFSRGSSAHASKIRILPCLIFIYLPLSPRLSLSYADLWITSYFYIFSASARKWISLLFPAYLSTIFDKTAFFCRMSGFSLSDWGFLRFLVNRIISIKTAFCCFYLLHKRQNTLYYRLCRSALCFRIWNDSSETILS